MSTHTALKQAALNMSAKPLHSTSPDTLTVATKKKRVATVKTKEPIKGGWDVLPHGLGKRGDLPQGHDQDDVIEEPARKRARKSKSGEDTPMNEGPDSVKLENQIKEKDIKADPLAAKGTVRRGRTERAQLAALATQELSTTTTEFVPVTTEALQENEPKTPGRKARFVKPTKFPLKDEEFKDENPRETLTKRKKNILDTLEGADKDSGKALKKEREKKHPYGLTPGFSPFPNHVMPTFADCEEVNRLLSELHGTITPPDVIPVPSMEVTGCGEVPDLLDAVLRTLLSGATSFGNSNMSLKGLKDKFGDRKKELGGGVNWEAIHQADVKTVISAIEMGGLGDKKGKYINKVLDIVYNQNCERRDALLREKEISKAAYNHEADHETKSQKDLEIAKYNENLLSIDYVFNLDNNEAMDELLKFPGVGVKTASCAILFCMQRPSFAVDTHVWRFCKWLKWVPQEADAIKTFSHCEVHVPNHLKYSLHQLFIRHGQTCGRCTAKSSPGSKEWEKTVCPIEHLVTRTSEMKTAKINTTKISTAKTSTAKTSTAKTSTAQISTAKTSTAKTKTNRARKSPVMVVKQPTMTKGKKGARAKKGKDTSGDSGEGPEGDVAMTI